MKKKGSTKLVDMSLLNPDMDGDGKVSRFEKEVHQMFVAADVDGSGALSVREFYAVLNKIRAEHETKSLFKKGLIVATILILLLIVVNAALSLAVTVAFKDVYAGGNVLKSTASGTPMHTGTIQTVANEHAPTRRRMWVDKHGRHLVERGTVTADTCSGAISVARATGQVHGSTSLSVGGKSQTDFFTGRAISEVPKSDGTTEITIHDANGPGSIVVTASTDQSVACPYATTVPTRTRELRLELHEMARMSAQRKLRGVDASDGFNLVPPEACLVYHCFAGDEGCTDPSPEEACMHWHDGACKEPLCRHHTLDEELPEVHGLESFLKAKVRARLCT